MFGWLELTIKQFFISQRMYEFDRNSSYRFQLIHYLFLDVDWFINSWWCLNNMFRCHMIVMSIDNLHAIHINIFPRANSSPTPAIEIHQLMLIQRFTLNSTSLSTRYYDTDGIASKLSFSPYSCDKRSCHPRIRTLSHCHVLRIQWSVLKRWEDI